MPRVFIAAPVAAEAKCILIDMINELDRIYGKSLRTVKPSTLHITMKFLGDVPGDKIRLMAPILDKHLLGITSFALGFATIGIFPQVGYPRTIWVGMKGDIEKLKSVKYVVDKAVFETLGFPSEKPGIVPHITLARANGYFHKDLLIDLRKQLSGYIEPPSFHWCVNQVELVKSILTASGPIHETLHRTLLK